MRRLLKRYREWNTFHKLTVASLRHRHGSAGCKSATLASMFHNNVRATVFRFLLSAPARMISGCCCRTLSAAAPTECRCRMILDNHLATAGLIRAPAFRTAQESRPCGAFWSSFSNRTADRVVGDGPCFHAVMVIWRYPAPYSKGSEMPCVNRICRFCSGGLSDAA